MRVSTLVRATVALSAVVALLAGAACASGGTANPSTSGAATSADPVAAGATDQPAGPANPCALLSAAEVATALSEKVSDTQRYETISDDTATVERCVLLTDAKPLNGAAFATLAAMAAGFTGEDMPTQTAAHVGVVRVTRTAAFDLAQGDAAKLPAGSKTLTGVGTFAVVLGVPFGGVAFAQTSPTDLVVVYDSEDSAVSATAMEALLRAAVSHV